MSEVKWIKIVVDIFDDEKIQLIESLPDGDSLLICWFKLLCLAGKMNNSGVMFLADKLPYTDEMLATIFRRPLQTVRLALSTFEQFGMVEIINGVITIPNWGKHQQLDEMEKIKEQNRLRQKKWYDKQKLLTDSSEKPNVRSNANLTQPNATDIEVDKDLEVEKDNSSTAVMEKWNALGFNSIRNLEGERKKLLNARIKEHGLEAVYEAIERVKASDFLKGQNKSGWTITFDWFIRPRNFQKVLEGNYDNRSENHASASNNRSTETSAAKWNIHYD